MDLGSASKINIFESYRIAIEDLSRLDTRSLGEGAIYFVMGLMAAHNITDTELTKSTPMALATLCCLALSTNAIWKIGSYNDEPDIE